jgi:hypothetical protein
MNEIVYNNYDLVAFEQNGEVVVAVKFYRYYKRKANGEVNYRWRTRCPELVDKIVKHRTRAFTGQLIQLAKAYGEKKVIKYQKGGGGSMSRYDRDAIEIYILDHIDADNYGKQFKYDRECLSFMLNVFKDEYKEHIKRDGIKKAFEDYIMSVPSIFRIHIADCDIRYLLRSWGVEFDEDDDEIYILYKRIIREVFFKMCKDMKVC